MISDRIVCYLNKVRCKLGGDARFVLLYLLFQLSYVDFSYQVVSTLKRENCLTVSAFSPSPSPVGTNRSQQCVESSLIFSFCILQERVSSFHYK